VRQLCQANCRSTEEVESRYGEVGRSVPVKIIWGVEDNWISHDTADSLGKALGAEEVVKIDGAGHLIMYDQPSQFGVEIGTWVTAVEGRSRTERREARDEVRR
jgi:pimeloyl-ACP methyl ester carboxylesterase